MRNILDARIVRVDLETAWADIGAKFDAPLPLSDWNKEEPSPKVGDIVKVVVDDDWNVDDRPLQITRLETRGPTRRIADSVEFKLYLSLINGERVSGRLAELTESGFKVDYAGLKIHLPLRYTSEAMQTHPDSFVGKTVSFRIAGQGDSELIVRLD